MTRIDSDDAKVQTVRFTITGEFLTQHCRSLYAEENRPDHAIKTLVTSLIGMTEEQAIAILTGRAKLLGDSRTGCKMVKDNAKKTRLGTKLPTLVELTAAMLKKEKRLEEDRYDNVHREYSPSPHGLAEIGHHALKRIKKGESTWEQETHSKTETYWVNRNEITSLKSGLDFDSPEATAMRQRAAGELAVRLAAGRPRSGAGLLDAFLANMKAMDEEEDKPAVSDPTLSSLNGWVDRSGNFYPCRYMGHARLAERLGEKEVTFEEKGWLKISDSKDPMCQIERDSDVLGTKDRSKYTEAQLSTIMTWCGKYNRRFPKWLKDEDEE